jgi:hypothetical protein
MACALNVRSGWFATDVASRAGPGFETSEQGAVSFTTVRFEVGYAVSSAVRLGLVLAGRDLCSLMIRTHENRR